MQISLDKTFEERDTLNLNIMESIKSAATDWGLRCMRYEIRDITPPSGVRAAMELQVQPPPPPPPAPGAVLDCFANAKPLPLVIVVPLACLYVYGPKLER